MEHNVATMKDVQDALSVYSTDVDVFGGWCCPSHNAGYLLGFCWADHVQWSANGHW